MTRLPREHIPDAALQARAVELGLHVRALDEDALLDEPEDNTGPFELVHECVLERRRYYRVWVTTLSAEGIAAALDCYERELELLSADPDADIGKAWTDFHG